MKNKNKQAYAKKKFWNKLNDFEKLLKDSTRRENDKNKLLKHNN